MDTQGLKEEEVEEACEECHELRGDVDNVMREFARHSASTPGPKAWRGVTQWLALNGGVDVLIRVAAHAFTTKHDPWKR